MLLFNFKSAEDTLLQIRTEVETLLGRLVVSHILRGYADAINGIFEEGVEAVLCRNGRYVEAQTVPK